MLGNAVSFFIAVWLIAGGAQTALGEKRVALVIGNDKYVNLDLHAQLKRAVNDARAVSRAFKELGFEVIEIEDVGRSAFNAQWQEFLGTVGEGDVVAFYFSGHGVEIEGLNFLIPSDIPLVKYGRQEQIKRESISVSELLLDLEKRKPGMTLLILDACREHPLIPDELRSAGAAPGGLAKMDPPKGTFIMYSAGAGQTALDRLPPPLVDPDPVDLVFTRKLLPLMRQKGLELTEMVREARRQVSALAATVPHAQTPAYYDGVLGKFCLAGCDPEPPHACDGLAGCDPEPPHTCDGLRVSVGPLREMPCIKPGSSNSFKDCPDCPEMVIVPSGSFTMGSPESEPGRIDAEGPRHKVRIAQPFAVGTFPITQREFEVFIKATGYVMDGCSVWLGDSWREDSEKSYKSPGFAQTNSDPVVCVNWDDAEAYVNWLSKRTGKVYRLLSEAEYEYVARAGTATPFWWGSSITPAMANYDGTLSYRGGTTGEYRRQTTRVKSFRPNAWGLYQVHGNVWSWTEDCEHQNYLMAPSDGSPWITGGCNHRVLRGGAWDANPRDLRSAYRVAIDRSIRDNSYGFRVARAIGP